MKRRASTRLTAILLAVLLCVGCVNLSVFAVKDATEETTATVPYLDTSLSFEERAADLVSRMTPEEKYAQLRARTAPGIPRLGVNAYDWWSEGLHGVARDGKATSFPTGLGIAATWDVDLVQQMLNATSDEARDKFNNHVNDHGLNYWSPTINMDRDPRWGRAEETYGEDPYLTSMIAEAFINGLQGDDASYLKTISTAKHFLANNSEQNRHNGSSNLDERDLREYYTLAFKYAVEDAKVGSIMTSYNAVNGVPMSVNEQILDGLLRRTWGFDGFVVTDCGALNDVVSNHKWRPEGWGNKAWGGKETAAYAIKAGTDLNCGGVLPGNTGAAVTNGLLSEDEVDRALVRLFTARMQTGEFDPDGGPFGGDQFDNQIHAADHDQLAEDGADNAVVLLKNQDNALPLSGEKIKSLVLLGDVADELILGDYSTNDPENTSTALEGIQAALKRANPDASFEYISVNGASSGSSPYRMNTRGPKLLDADGNVLRQIDLNANAELNNCKVEASGNMGYIYDGSWAKFNPGTIDFTGVKQFSVEMAGDTNVGPTRLEIRAMDPVSGPLLAAFDGVGNTGGWQNYQTYTSDAAVGGGYGDQPIYMVWKTASVNFEYSEAQSAAIAAADVVVFFAGTRPGENGYAEESDGVNLNLPNNQDSMINGAAALNDNVIVYMQAVSQINVEPFKDNVKAILWSTYNGQAQGNAAGRLLFGEANPSAKLPFTWYTDVNQLANIKDYQIRADENNNGRTYQYFTGDVTYPFGFGLSYSSFAYSNLKISKDTVTPNDTITVEFDVTNTSAVDGQEVAQLYVASPDAAANDRPVKRLKGFDKKMIAAGETAHFTLTLDVADLWYWDAENQVQLYDQGVYTIQIGSDSDAAANLTANFTLSGQLTPELHTATAIPSGHILDMNKAGKKITTTLSASRDDQTFVDLTADGVEVTYTTSNPEVAVVDDQGTVTAVGNGVATITASVTENGVTKTDSFPVRVSQPIVVDNIFINGKPMTGFTANAYNYNVAVTSMENLPQVTAEVKSNFTCTVKQATTEDPTATVTVTAGNESVNYAIHFVLPPQSFDFTKTSKEEFLDVWQVINPDDTHWKIDEKGLTITTQKGDIYQTYDDAKNILVQPAADNWLMEAKVVYEKVPTVGYQQAAIMVYQDNDNYVKLSYELGPQVQLGSEFGGAWTANRQIKVTATTIWYRLEKIGNHYEASFSTDGVSYTSLGGVDRELLDPKIGLLAVNSYPDNVPELDVTFEYMTITQTVNCTCDLYDLTTDEDQNIVRDNTNPVTYALSADAKARGGCQMEGHDLQPVYTYEILSAGETGATIEDNVLTVPKDGKVSVLVTASLHDATPLTKEVVFNVETTAAAQQAQVEQVVALIDAIGSTVTLDSEEAIVAARAAYEALVTQAQKDQISNLAVLEAAEENLADLKNVLAVVNQPEAFAGQIGDTATFHVDVTRQDVTYQWMYSNNGGKSFVKSSMTGADTDTLTVEMKAFRVGQMYKCVVTDAKGNVVETEAVAMTTATTVAIVTDPVDYAGAVGETAVFTVEAQGENLTYQWMYSNNEGRSWTKSTLPGYNTPEVSVVLKAFRAGQMYKCVVTDASGNVVESKTASIVIG